MEAARGGLALHRAEALAEQLIELLEAQGDCPSLVAVRGSEDPEAKDLASHRDLLSQVSLRDHTARVAWHALRLLHEQFHDPAPLVAKVFLAALGHDLGKIPALRARELYSKHDHPSISVMKLKEYLGGFHAHWADELCHIIKEHHLRTTKHQMTRLLQRADECAREEEIAGQTPGYRITPWPTWFDYDAWLAELSRDINVLRGRVWQAMTWQGVVYGRIDWLYEGARRQLRQRQGIDLAFTRASDKDTANVRLVDQLREHDHLAFPIGKGYYGLPYEVVCRVPMPGRPYLVPIRLEAFGGLASAFESRKSGVLTLIEAVRPIAVKARPDVA